MIGRSQCSERGTSSSTDPASTVNTRVSSFDDHSPAIDSPKPISAKLLSVGVDQSLRECRAPKQPVMTPPMPRLGTARHLGNRCQRSESIAADGVWLVSDGHRGTTVNST